jgi:hypothetical protein
MNPTIVRTRPDVVSITSEPRPTPRPPQEHFSQVLSRSASTVVRGAELAMATLPGAPLVAAAVRGGPSPLVGASPVPTQAAGLAVPFGTPGTLNVAEGPGAVAGGTAVGGVVPSAVDGSGGGLEASLAQSQAMNLYFLQVQEEVNAQNRSYTALSNVLKTEHDTVKTAIGNMH